MRPYQPNVVYIQPVLLVITVRGLQEDVLSVITIRGRHPDRLACHHRPWLHPDCPACYHCPLSAPRTFVSYRFIVFTQPVLQVFIILDRIDTGLPFITMSGLHQNCSAFHRPPLSVPRSSCLLSPSMVYTQIVLSVIAVHGLHPFHPFSLEGTITCDGSKTALQTHGRYQSNFSRNFNL